MRWKINSNGYFSIEISLWMMLIMVVVFSFISLNLSLIDQALVTRKQQETIWEKDEPRTKEKLLFSDYEMKNMSLSTKREYSRAEMKTMMSILQMLLKKEDCELFYVSEMKVKEINHRQTLLKWQEIKQMGEDLIEKTDGKEESE